MVVPVSHCSRSGVFALCALLGANGCYRWMPTAQDSFRSGGTDYRQATLRVRADTGEREQIVLHRTDYPFVEGWSAQRNEEIRVNLREYQHVEVRRFSALSTAGLVLGIGAGAAVSYGLLVLVGLAIGNAP